MSHSKIILIPPEVRDFTIDEVAKALQEFRPETFRLQNIIRIQIADWEIKIYLNQSTTVLLESQQIAENIDHPQKERIAVCDRRFELRSTPDSTGTYRKDFERILSILMKVKGAISMDFSY